MLQYHKYCLTNVSSSFCESTIREEGTRWGWMSGAFLGFINIRGLAQRENKIFPLDIQNSFFFVCFIVHANFFIMLYLNKQNTQFIITLNNYLTAVLLIPKHRKLFQSKMNTSETDLTNIGLYASPSHGFAKLYMS